MSSCAVPIARGPFFPRLLMSWCDPSETGDAGRAATTSVDHARATLHARREGYVRESVADAYRTTLKSSAACSTPYFRARRREHAWGASVTRTEHTPEGLTARASRARDEVIGRWVAAQGAPGRVSNGEPACAVAPFLFCGPSCTTST